MRHEGGIVTYVLISVSHFKFYHLNSNREVIEDSDRIPPGRNLIFICSKPPEFPHFCIVNLIAGFELLAHVGFPVEMSLIRVIL